MTPSSFRPAT